MGLISRINDLLLANAHHAIDQAENPEVMLKQVIRDMDRNIQDARTAVVPGHAEPLEAERIHDLDVVERHGALRVIDVIVAARRLAAVAVAAQIGHDDRELLGQPPRNLVPLDVCLWVAVNEQQRWAAATDERVNRCP